MASSAKKPRDGRRSDELESLHAIYDGLVPSELHLTSCALAAGSMEVKVHVRGIITATFILPSNYPTTCPPQLSLSIGGDVSFAKAQVMRPLSSELEALFETEPGNEVLFAAIEILRDKAALCTLSTDDDHGEEEQDEQKVTALPAAIAVSSLAIHHSVPLVERKSTFIAHCCEVRSMDDVREFRTTVLADKRNARATHNIFAYRFTCERSGITHNDCDDDGETAAGTRLAELLRLVGLKRGAAVVVTRWFGGVLLGPDRFKYINNAARHLLEDRGFV